MAPGEGISSPILTTILHLANWQPSLLYSLHLRWCSYSRRETWSLLGNLDLQSKLQVGSTLRIYISDRKDSTRHRVTKIWITQPLPACSVRRAGSAVNCRQSGERLGESNLCKTMAGAVPSITDIYSLFKKLTLNTAFIYSAHPYFPFDNINK